MHNMYKTEPCGFCGVLNILYIEVYCIIVEYYSGGKFLFFVHMSEAKAVYMSLYTIVI